MNKFNKFLKDFLWFAIGNLGSKSIVFIMTPIYARYLSQVDFGKMDLINSTVSLLIPLVSFRISLGLFRFIVDEDEDKKEIINNTLVVLIISILVIFIMSPFLYRIEFLRTYFIFFISILVFNILIDLLKAYLKSTEQVKILASGDILHTLVIAIANIVLIIKLGKGVSGYFNSMVFAQISIIIFYLIKSDIMKNVNLKKAKWNKIKSMIIFSIPLIPNTMNFWIMNTSDRYMLNYFLGYAATGVYAIAYKMPTILFVINDIFQQSWQIAGVKNYKDDDSEKFNSVINTNSFSFLTIIVSGLIISIQFIMRYFGGESFYEAWIYTPFLLISTIFTSMSSFLGVAYIASKDTKGAFYTSIIGSLVNIVINLILIPQLGIQAAAISTLISYFAIWIMRVWQTKKHLKIQYNWSVIISSIGILFLQCFVLYSLNNNPIIQCILLALVMIINRSIIISILNIFTMMCKKIFNMRKYM